MHCVWQTRGTYPSNSDLSWYSVIDCLGLLLFPKLCNELSLATSKCPSTNAVFIAHLQAKRWSDLIPIPTGAVFRLWKNHSAQNDRMQDAWKQVGLLSWMLSASRGDFMILGLRYQGAYETWPWRMKSGTQAIWFGWWRCAVSCRVIFLLTDDHSTDFHRGSFVKHVSGTCESKQMFSPWYM